MTKLEYLRWCFEHKGYGLKACLQAMLGIQFEDPDSSGLFKEIPYAVYVEGGKFWTLVDDKPVHVAGDVTQALFHVDDKLSLPEDFHPCLKRKAYDTTFGIFMFNVVLFWETWEGLVDYHNGSFTKDLIEGILRDLMVDDPKEGETVPEGKSSATQCLKFTEGCYFLEGVGAHFIKPGGVDVLQVDPAITKFLEEQFKLHKDTLNDPVVFTEIITKAVAMDMEIQMNGPSKNFFINKKFVETARKRMFLAFGIEPDPSGEGWRAIPESLNTGIDPNHLVTYINTAVSGSHSRSMATGEGGARVKDTLRLIGRSTVAEQDCQSPVGEPVMVVKQTLKSWVGSYRTHNGKVEKLTKEILEGLLGKTIFIRVTEYCRTGDGNYCSTCCGESLGAYATRISAEVVLIPTASMLQRMKAAHSAGGTVGHIDMDFAVKD